MAKWKPNASYDHVFAIVRIGDGAFMECDPEAAITVKKIVWSQQEAEQEVARLNRQNRDRGALYFRQITRLERRSADEQEPVRAKQ
jgi:hypothetical protein